ncbi:MAG TPA: DUF4190 domain-containing protein [Mycobacterium sp.]|jgi:hypothetical protein
MSQPAPRANGLAIASVILGLIGLLTSWLVIGMGFGIGALSTGLTARRRENADAAGGLATAGIVLGSLSIVIALVGLGLIVWYFAMETTHDECWPYKQHAGCY